MHVITDPAALARALDSPLPAAVKRLLLLRRDLLGTVSFVVAEPGDLLHDVEAAVGLPLATNLIDGSRYGEVDFTPSFEWALDHGGAFELPYILTDDGGGVVLIVPDDDRVDASLLALAREYAEATGVTTIG